MTEFRAARACPLLPAMRIGQAPQRHSVGFLGLDILSRGLLVVAALALPVLGLRLADLGSMPQPGMMQAAAVPVPPPVRTAAALRLR